MIDFPASPTTNQIFTVGGTSWRYNGASWAAYTGSLVGDITSVVAGTGLTGGGTSGDVTLNLANTAVAAGSYTYATLTVDAQGRLTAASSGAPSALGFVGDTAPASPAAGQFWWNSSPGDGQLYLYYNDGTSSQWVVANNPGSGIYLPLVGGQLNPGGLLVGTAGSVPGQGALTLNANTVAPPAYSVGNSNLTAIAANGSGAQVQLDCFGAGTINAIFNRASRGTAAAPTALQNGDFISLFRGQGRTATGYSNNGAVSINLKVTENWTDTANGTGLDFITTINGTTTLTPSLTLQGNTATFSGNVFSGGNVTVPSGGAFSVTGGIVIGTGFSTKAGNSGATDGHTFNIYYGAGPAHLWVDNSDLGAINLTPCDERLKTNLKAPTVDALGAINAIALKQFDWLANDLVPEHHEDIGFTAQQLAECIPCAVDLHEDNPDQMASVQLTPIVAHLIGAVQQLTARLKAGGL